jgi:hypothetical protein
VHAVSFGQNEAPTAAGSCERRGVAGVFTEVGGTWRSAGLALPATLGRDQVQVLGLAGPTAGGTVLMTAGNSLLAAWPDGARWTVSAPVAAGTVRASGFGTGGSAWLLLGGGRAETVAGPGHPWQALPVVPAGTATLAPGPGGSYEALAVAGAKLTVWRLGQGAWAKVQLINVPIQYGSSS